MKILDKCSRTIVSIAKQENLILVSFGKCRAGPVMNWPSVQDLCIQLVRTEGPNSKEGVHVRCFT